MPAMHATIADLSDTTEQPRRAEDHLGPSGPSIDADPVRSAGVHLIGQMQDVGFEESQWLVEREGQFVQLSEVLYRILERADGRRSLCEIAAHVTDSTEWLVDESTIRLLIDSKLIPLRLIARRELANRSSPSRSVPGSILGVNMRMIMFPERLVSALAGRLQLLFSPPFLIALVAVSGAAHLWMYVIHGVRGSVSEVLYTPGALLAVFAIIVAAGFVHELGHAAALRYGGGRARGIGVGLYLIFPAFYTDATDAYRLGRTARVRVDLGGIYFHLLCALVLILLSAWSRRELLLFAAFLLNIEALRQFIPFVRLDGYWAIADLTGIPDFFSQMGPFLKSTLPLSMARRFAASSLPALRPVARTVFAAYTFAVVPVLVYLMGRMAIRLPDFLNTTRDALLVQAHTVSAGAPFITDVLAITQIFFLATPVVGTVYILGTMGWSVLTTIGRVLPPPARRFAGALSVATGSVALVLWFDAGTGAAKNQDHTTAARRVNELIANARQAMAGTDTLEADLDGQIGADHFTGTLALKRPNLARLQIRGTEGLGDFLVDSDGKEVFVYFPDDKLYTRAAVSADGTNIDGFIVDPVRNFFAPQTIGSAPDGALPQYVGARRLDDVDGEVLVLPAAVNRKATFYFVSKGDHLLRRVTHGTAIDGSAAGTNWVQLKNVRRNSGSITHAQFEWSIPPDATPLQVPSTLTLPGKPPGTSDGASDRKP
jgi:putative peptide zinc metalloprotease protein